MNAFLLITFIYIAESFEFPITEREQYTLSGYFSNRGTYLGGLPSIKEYRSYSTCDSLNNDTCTSWDIREEGVFDQYCNCTNDLCIEWECFDIYTDIKTSSCSCTTNECKKWTCSGIKEEKIRKSKNTIIEKVVFNGEFNCLNDNCTNWNGLTSSDFRNIQEACSRNENDWNCYKKMTKNCNRVNDIWCDDGSMFGFSILVPLFIFGIILLILKNYSWYFIFLGIFFIGLLYAIVLAGGTFGIIYVSILSLVSSIISICIIKKYII